jgi:hypothetical protein
VSLGRTVISTTIGAEGIHYIDGKNILIADTPVEFISQVKKCICDKEFCLDIGKNAKRLMQEEYDNDLLVEKSVLFYKSLLSETK